ncbi:MAG: hypothetical protein AAF891_09045 [Pseudomonadota bacterium]
MTRFEYKVIPAPLRGKRGKGVKGHDGKFAFALQGLMNDMGLDGWEYQRAETLPSEERSGLTGRTTVYRNMLVFRRPLATDPEAFEPELLDPPTDIEDEMDKDAARDADEALGDYAEPNATGQGDAEDAQDFLEDETRL